VSEPWQIVCAECSVRGSHDITCSRYDGVIHLSPEETARLDELLANPPEPTEALIWLVRDGAMRT
jgi:hypothetical protein